MEFARPRKSECVINDKQEDSFLVKSNVSWFVRISTVICTIIMWLYSIIVVYMLVSGLLNHTDPYIAKVKTALKVTNHDIQSFFYVSAILISGIFLVLYGWRTYNKCRFGKLNRRHTPKPTTDQEMLNLNLIDAMDYMKLQENNVVIFEKNPIKDIEKQNK